MSPVLPSAQPRGCTGAPRSSSVSLGLCLWGSCFWGFPHSSVRKESACNAGDPGSIPGSGRSPAEGNGNPLQYSCLENPMAREAWQESMGLQESDRTEYTHFAAITVGLYQLGFCRGHGPRGHGGILRKRCSLSRKECYQGRP